MSNFKNIKISDLPLHISDGNYSSKYPRADEMVSHGVPFIRANNLKNGTVIWEDMKYISSEKHEELQKGHLEEGDVLITVRGDIGKLSIVPRDFVDANINAQIALLRVYDRSKLDNKFLFYSLNTPNVIKQFNEKQTGTALKQLPIKSLREVSVLIPAIKEQQKIAEILSSVDAAIEKTEQVIAKTEEVKKGLMQQLLTKGIGHTEFKESLFGLIPNDWMLVSLSEVADVRDGTHDSPKYQSSGIPFITSKNLRNGKIDFSDCNYITIEDHKKFSVRSFVEKGDILFGMIGTIGSPVIVDIDIDFSIKNVALIKLNKDIVDNRYMKYLLESNLIQKEFSRVSDGGVQKFVALSTIRKLKVPLPNLYEQQKIAKILLNQDSYLDSQFKKLSYLQEIKKGLMQQLLTGQVRVGALC